MTRNTLSGAANKLPLDSGIKPESLAGFPLMKTHTATEGRGSGDLAHSPSHNTGPSQEIWALQVLYVTDTFFIQARVFASATGGRAKCLARPPLEPTFNAAGAPKWAPDCPLNMHGCWN